MKFRGFWALAVVLPVLGGCHALHAARVASCYKPQPYQQAGTVAPLRIPAGLDTPDTAQALVVPALKGPVPPPPKLGQPCLDAPPSYNVPQAQAAPKA